MAQGYIMINNTRYRKACNAYVNYLKERGADRKDNVLWENAQRMRASASLNEDELVQVSVDSVVIPFIPVKPA